MNRLERIYDPEETLRAAMESTQARMWTALPGIIESFDAEKNTCSIRPAITHRIIQQDGTWMDLEPTYLLLDCPVVWQGGGGCTMTFPIKQGDECLVVFASRCIDAWWYYGKAIPTKEQRMHNLSDGFALVGVRSLPRAFPIDQSAVQLRSDDGAAFVQINPESHAIDVVTSGNITAEAAGQVEITAPTIRLNGAIVLNGPITQANTAGGSTTAEIIGPIHVTNDVTAGGKSLEHHVHSGVYPGSGNTGKPA